MKELEQLERAVVSYEKAISLKPKYAEAYNNFGAVLKELGRLEEALGHYEYAVNLKPEYAAAYNNIAVISREMGKRDEVIPYLKKAIELSPNYAEAHYNLGNLYMENRRIKMAVDSYQSAIGINSDYFEAYNHLGDALRYTGKIDDSIINYRKALELKPDFLNALSNLAIALNASGRRSEALEYFSKRLELERGDNPSNPEARTFRFITKAKMRHDIEQFRYLVTQKQDAERFIEIAGMYETVDKEIGWPSEDTKAIPLSEEHRDHLGTTYNRSVHLLEAAEVSGSSLSDTLDVEKITEDYFSHAAGMTYFDDLLSREALSSLRRFLLGSTIWVGFDYPGGYLGSMLIDGLACPLLLQISDDLRRTFPDIFKNHQLTQLWAYKYDSSLTGIEVHADFAAVNVNFWITPETANMNPESGGLVVYDAEAPLDWDFRTYNNNQRRIREFLDEHDSGKTVVPYRENRIVLFNSNLFHETDTIEFKQGYENRRINITMLFGDRTI